MLMYKYSLQINQHLKLKNNNKQGRPDICFQNTSIYNFFKSKYFWETLIILTHSKEEIKAHHHETLKH